MISKRRSELYCCDNISLIENYEIRYASEWSKLGYKFTIKVAQDKNKSCKNLHFEFVDSE